MRQRLENIERIRTIQDQPGLLQLGQWIPFLQQYHVYQRNPDFWNHIIQREHRNDGWGDLLRHLDHNNMSDAADVLELELGMFNRNFQ